LGATLPLPGAVSFLARMVAKWLLHPKGKAAAAANKRRAKDEPAWIKDRRAGVAAFLRVLALAINVQSDDTGTEKRCPKSGPYLDGFLSKGGKATLSLRDNSLCGMLGEYLSNRLRF
jgi:hypothetical protein